LLFSDFIILKSAAAIIIINFTTKKQKKHALKDLIHEFRQFSNLRWFNNRIV